MKRVRRFNSYSLGASVYVTLVLLGLYASVRIMLLIHSSGYPLADGIMAAALVAAELFLCVHGVGYIGAMLKAERLAEETRPLLFAPPSSADVAILIASYNEPLDVLEETIAAVLALDYPGAHPYLLDDSTDEQCRRDAAALAARYAITLVQRTTRVGYKAGAMNELIPKLREPYIALLDADQRPKPAWLKDLVPLLDAEPKLALIQVPQVYGNIAGLPVARAAAYQQAIFFEYICEGKSRSNAMFCCGSNAIVRKSALEAIARVVDGRTQYFDETSVTEDFATSVQLHMAGWRTQYVNAQYVIGMGPETLPAYFTQQMRWAMGTLAVGLRLLRFLVRHPRALHPAQWWEYLLSGTYYFTGFANFIFLTAPIAFLAFEIQPLRGQAYLYLLAFIPYVAMTTNLVFYGMRLRGYAPSGVWVASALSFSTMWTYMKAALVALLGTRRTFGVTPKGVGGYLPFTQLLPEWCFFMGSLTAAIGGIAQMVYAGPSLAYGVNTFWAAYHAVTWSVLFVHLNRPVTIAGREPTFTPVASRSF
jgi:cellulose synthase/poly-beta-1,6-N-acetylglucosamine synthase-like glycosyltransferase